MHIFFDYEEIEEEVIGHRVYGKALEGVAAVEAWEKHISRHK